MTMRHARSQPIQHQHSASPTLIGTIQEICAEAKETLNKLYEDISGLKRLHHGHPINLGQMRPTSMPLEILLEIALSKNVGKASLTGLQRIAADPKAALGLDYSTMPMHEGGELAKTVNFVNDGRPRMYYVLVNRNSETWLVGSTAMTMNSMQVVGAQDFLRETRAQEIGEAYTDMCGNASDMLEKDDPKKTGSAAGQNLAPRRQAMQELQQSDLFLGRMKDWGIALNQGLTVDKNCYRCRATFRIREVPNFEEKKVNKSIQTYQWDQRKQKHACAECSATLKSAIANRAANLREDMMACKQVSRMFREDRSTTAAPTTTAPLTVRDTTHFTRKAPRYCPRRLLLFTFSVPLDASSIRPTTRARK